MGDKKPVSSKKQEENLGIKISEMVQLVVVARVSFFQRK